MTPAQILGGVIVAVSLLSWWMRKQDEAKSDGGGVLPLPPKPSPDKKKSGDVPSNHDTDKPPPEGFADHVDVIIRSSQNATPAVREAYFREGLTEAAVLRKEATRMAEILTPKTNGSREDRSVEGGGDAGSK